VLRILFDDALEPERAEARTVTALLCGAERLAVNAGLEPRLVHEGRLGGSRMFDDALPESARRAIEAFVEIGETNDRAGAVAHRLGELLDALLAARMEAEGRAPGQHAKRRRDGSFFTPRTLAARVARQALEPFLGSREPTGLRVCDPAVGGGAFLIESAMAVAEALERRGASREEARLCAARGMYGVDRSETAVGVSELALWLFAGTRGRAPHDVGAHLAVGDALLGDVWRADLRSSRSAFHFYAAFPEAKERGFDLVIGNPPWVAYAGRSAQPLDPGTRSYFRARFRAAQGFPTLHGLFVERAAELAPRGRIALLLPSALSDLDGYRGARAALAETHAVVEPLAELGQDAFDGVVQPCFVLVADARTAGSRPDSDEATRPWRLVERQRQGVELTRAAVPSALERLASFECLPAETFREIGFQSNRVVSERLFVRGERPASGTIVPLLEGRNVAEFRQSAPRLYLRADDESLKSAATRLRPIEQYQAVVFVVRQTAAVTIAARHGGEAFRNSLLAGYAVGELDGDLLVGLLNSSLYRALHKSRQRDARQAAFPQVKIGHLRRLPAPPESKRTEWSAIRALSARASELGACDLDLRAELDRAVAGAFGLDAGEVSEVVRYLVDRAPSPHPASNEQSP
jgi:hypothetical protein